SRLEWIKFQLKFYNKPYHSTTTTLLDFDHEMLLTVKYHQAGYIIVLVMYVILELVYIYNNFAKNLNSLHYIKINYFACDLRTHVFSREGDNREFKIPRFRFTDLRRRYLPFGTSFIYSGIDHGLGHKRIHGLKFQSDKLEEKFRPPHRSSSYKRPAIVQQENEKNLKVVLQPIGKYYAVGVILANCHPCLYGSTTSSFFELPPPDLQTYLHN
ncbi:Hypothetical predicted protein, partial [Paramuricea clavata]